MACTTVFMGILQNRNVIKRPSAKFGKWSGMKIQRVHPPGKGLWLNPRPAHVTDHQINFFCYQVSLIFNCSDAQGSRDLKESWPWDPVGLFWRSDNFLDIPAMFSQKKKRGDRCRLRPKEDRGFFHWKLFTVLIMWLTSSEVILLCKGKETISSVILLVTSNGPRRQSLR